jgi:hypothetical protein
MNELLIPPYKISKGCNEVERARRCFKGLWLVEP